MPNTSCCSQQNLRWRKGNVQFVLFLVCLLFSGVAHSRSEIFSVNSTADKIDDNPGDGICKAGIFANSRKIKAPKIKTLKIKTGLNECTLRAAIMEANALQGHQIIEIPDGVYKLTLETDHSGYASVAERGDLDIFDDLSILGKDPRSTIIDGGGAYRVFTIGGQPPRTEGHPDIEVALDNLTIQNGVALSGAGILIATAGNSFSSNVTMTNCIVQHNHCGLRPCDGGGIAAIGARLSVIKSSITNNGSVPKEVGCYSVDSHKEGGGLSLSGGETKIINSTISGNISCLGSAILASHSTLDDIEDDLLEIKNSTIIRNLVAQPGPPGHTGINDSPAVVVTGGAGGPPVKVVLERNIIAENMLLETSVPNNLSISLNNEITSDGYNIIEISPDYYVGDWPVSSDQLDFIRVGLGSLDYYGGQTLVHSLLDGSPAINAGGICDKRWNVKDQRGQVRKKICDVGAYEYTVCGDGERDIGEQCDDGNRNNGDECDSRCRL